jgi:hypothetical protein
MKKILLKNKDIEFLLDNLKNHLIKKKIKNSRPLNKGKEALLEIEDIELILNELSDLLIEKGLNENKEPNSLGFYIESLIDTFNRTKYEN